jgi:hypothetical protein
MPRKYGTSDFNGLILQILLEIFFLQNLLDFQCFKKCPTNFVGRSMLHVFDHLQILLEIFVGEFLQQIL